MIESEQLDCVVSLTSWRGRIFTDTVGLTLYSLLKQETGYRYRVVLVLSRAEFPRMEAELPEYLSLMASAEPKFRILWTGKNTRALKKLDPTVAAYPGIPVITTDDDIIVRPDFVQSFMDCHRRNPRHAIYAHMFDFPGNREIKVSGWGRLFPPGSLADIDTGLFDSVFHGLEDDVWNGIRVWLKGTPVMKLGKWPFVDQVPIGNTAFSNVYLKCDPVKCYRELMKKIGRL